MPRPLTYEERQLVIARGRNPDGLVYYEPGEYEALTTQQTPTEPQTSGPIGAFSRSAARNVLPGVGGGLGWLGGGALGTALVPFTGGASVVPLVGSILGSLAGGAAGNIAQRKALGVISPEALRSFEQSEQQDLEQQKIASIVGGITGAGAGGGLRPSIAAFKDAAKGVRGLATTERLATLPPEQLAGVANVVGGAALGGGVEAGRQLYNQEFEPVELGAAIVGGATFNTPTKLGKVYGFSHSSPEASPRPQPDIVRTPDGRLITPVEAEIRAKAREAIAKFNAELQKGAELVPTETPASISAGEINRIFNIREPSRKSPVFLTAEEAAAATPYASSAEARGGKPQGRGVKAKPSSTEETFREYSEVGDFARSPEGQRLQDEANRKAYENYLIEQRFLAKVRRDNFESEQRKFLESMGMPKSEIDKLSSQEVYDLLGVTEPKYQPLRKQYDESGVPSLNERVSSEDVRRAGVEASRRGVWLARAEEPIITPSGERAAGISQDRVAAYDPAVATKDTPLHEVTHEFLEDLKYSKDPEDRKVYSSLEKVFKTDQTSTANEKLAQSGGVAYVERLAAQSDNPGVRQRAGEFLKDFRAAWKRAHGDMSPEDAGRYLAAHSQQRRRYEGDPAFSEGRVKDATPRYQRFVPPLTDESPEETYLRGLKDVLSEREVYRKMEAPRKLPEGRLGEYDTKNKIASAVRADVDTATHEAVHAFTHSNWPTLNAALEKNFSKLTREDIDLVGQYFYTARYGDHMATAANYIKTYIDRPELNNTANAQSYRFRPVLDEAISQVVSPTSPSAVEKLYPFVRKIVGEDTFKFLTSDIKDPKYSAQWRYKHREDSREIQLLSSEAENLRQARKVAEESWSNAIKMAEEGLLKDDDIRVFERNFNFAAERYKKAVDKLNDYGSRGEFYQEAKLPPREVYGKPTPPDEEPFSIVNVAPPKVITPDDVYKLNYPNVLQRVVSSAIDKIRYVGGRNASIEEKKVNNRGADSVENMFHVETLYNGKYREQFSRLVEESKLTAAEARDLKTYRWEMHHNRRSNLQEWYDANPKIKSFNEGFQNLLVEARLEQNAVGPEITTAEGGRKGKIDPFYDNDAISPVVRRNVTDNRTAHAELVEEIKRFWTDKLNKRNPAGAGTNGYNGPNFKKASKDVEDYIKALGSHFEGQESKKFNALRKAEGYGLPLSWVDRSVVNSGLRYFARYAKDMAHFRTVESDDVARAIFDIPDQYGSKENNATHLEDGTPINDRTNSLPSNKEAAKAFESSLKYHSDLESQVFAASRAVTAGWLGPWSGVRDLTSSFIHNLAYVGPVDTTRALVDTLKDFRTYYNESFLQGVNRSKISAIEFAAESTNEVADKINRFSDIVAQFQGRNRLEKITRGVQYGIGKNVAKYVLGRGNAVESRNFLRVFGKNIDNPEQYIGRFDIPDDILNEIASQWVERNQGTYTAAGLPAGAVKGQFAGLLGLARWGIEKQNIMYKDVWLPLKLERNIMPLLRVTLGAFLGGEVIRKLGEVINNRLDYVPDWNELVSSEKTSINDIIANLATAANMSGYFGIASQMAFDAHRIISGRPAQGFVTLPALDYVRETALNHTTDFINALHSGEKLDEAFLKFVDLMLNDSVQSMKILSQNTYGAEEQERKKDFRDLAIFRSMEGARPDFTRNSPQITGMSARQFDRTADLNVAQKALPGAVNTAVTQSQGDPTKLLNNLRAVGRQQTLFLPNPSTPQGARELQRYKAYITATKGAAAWNALVEKYIQKQHLDAQKKALFQQYIHQNRAEIKRRYESLGVR